MSLITSSTILLISILILLRILVSLHPHSGQNNYHGSTVAWGGDYEAQRHWMELTVHLPLSKWYTYETSYWGLDYPPLTAYGSYILGIFSQQLVGKESVALDTSRAFENSIHKAYMRGTVLFLDVIYFFAVWIIAKRLRDFKSDQSFSFILISALAQPGIVLIDHGHFQYNSVCLGLSLLSFHYFSLLDENKAIGKNAIIGSFLFCLALNWKQMGLYYAPAVFSYLLGRCFSSTNFVVEAGVRWSQVLIRIGTLGAVVISTFGVLFGPFIYYRDMSSQTIEDVIFIILRRIFPFQRGLFEGKVANLWCFLSIKPISIRERLPQGIQPTIALGLTLTMALPFCIILFMVGKEGYRRGERQQQRHLKALLWGTAGVSLSFFLASFQVHEKSILIPLAPFSLLIMEAPPLIIWFSIVSTWTLWHLLQIDRLQLPYFCTSIVFSCLVTAFFPPALGCSKQKTDSLILEWGGICFVKIILPVSTVIMAGLHMMEILISPPSHIPDIFPVLWVISGCIFFSLTWIGALYFLWLDIIFADGGNTLFRAKSFFKSD